MQSQRIRDAGHEWNEPYIRKPLTLETFFTEPAFHQFLNSVFRPHRCDEDTVR